MIQFEVNGHQYQARKLDLFDQMVLAKRLTPIFTSILTPDVLGAITAAKAPATEDATATETPSRTAFLSGANSTKMLEAMGSAIHGLADEDLKIITTMCLRICQRQTTGTGGVWGAVVAANGMVLYDDITLPDMLQIVWKVIEQHLAGFFSTAPSPSK